MPSFDLFDAPMATDRSAGFAWIRQFGDVFQASDGTWVLASPEAVRFAHRNPDLFSSAKAFGATGLPISLIPVAIDPPDHVRYRRILDPMLAPRVINAMEDELRAQIRELVEAFASTGRCDAVADVARLYPTQVFLTLFGLPLADRDKLIGWVETMNENSKTGTGEASPVVREAAGQLFGYMHTAIQDKRGALGDDMLSRVLSLTGEDAWTDEELLGLAVLFTVAGLDTVTSAIGFTMLHLAQDPELRHRLQADPELMIPVIDEVLRIEPPAPTTPRVTTQDVELCGVTIPANSPVMLCLATANRGEERAQPNAIDLEHARDGHVSFGGGIHRCLGSHLARREIRLVVEEFHRVIPDYEVAPGVVPEIVWPSSTLHLASLPLVFPPAVSSAT
jgi:cytochrome P450